MLVEVYMCTSAHSLHVHAHSPSHPHGTLEFSYSLSHPHVTLLTLFLPFRCHTLPPIPMADLNFHTLARSVPPPCHTSHTLPPIPMAHLNSHTLRPGHAHVTLYGTHLTLSLPALICTLSLDHLAEGW